jgi:hypothetical protein
VAIQDIQESDPVRRNLVFLSSSIILFYLADGQMQNDFLKLHVINIQFNKPTIFVHFIWILLFWFLFRYWQHFGFNFRRIVNENIIQYSTNRFTIKLAETKYGVYYRKDKGFNHVTIYHDYQKNLWFLTIQPCNINYDEEGNISSYSSYTPEKPFDPILLEGIKGKFIVFYLIIKILIFKPELINLIYPYLLGIFAIIIFGIKST